MKILGQPLCVGSNCRSLSSNGSVSREEVSRRVLSSSRCRYLCSSLRRSAHEQRQIWTCNRGIVFLREASRIGSVRCESQREKLESLSTVVTDDDVPDGHKGLHGFLYGEAGADVHDSGSKEFLGRDGEDDGSSVLEFEEYVGRRNGLKFSGVYGIYDKDGNIQYVSYSRNVILSLRSLRNRAGSEKCASVKVKLYTTDALISRAKLEEEREKWLEVLEQPPPGNSSEKSFWEDGSRSVPVQLMAVHERQDYEEKKLKMRKAMGENLFDDVAGEDDDSRTRRLKLLQATEGDDWSSVIDGQTKVTEESSSDGNGRGREGGIERNKIEVKADNPAQIVSPFSKSVAAPVAVGGLYSAESFELTMENVDVVLNDVRPYLIADGGNVEVVSLDNGVVSLRLQGACGTCPSSTSTMKMGIERVLNEKFGGSLKGVMQVEQMQLGATVDAVNSHLDMLRPAIHNYGGSVEVVSVSSCSKECVVKYKGPAPIGMGIQAAIKDKFPDISNVILVDP